MVVRFPVVIGGHGLALPACSSPTPPLFFSLLSVLLTYLILVPTVIPSCFVLKVIELIDSCLPAVLNPTLFPFPILLPVTSATIASWDVVDSRSFIPHLPARYHYRTF